MGKNAIASGSAILTADADGLIQGLDRTAAKTQAWAAQVSRHGQAVNKSFAGLGSNLADKFTAGAVMRLGSEAVGSVMATGHRLAETLLDSITDTSKQGAMARALGLTPEAFTGVAGVAKSVGEDTREFVESLVTMGKLGSDAANNVGDVAGPAFKALGLDAQKFVRLGADEQFYTMFDALSKVGDSLTRTRLLMNAFGEDGGKYLLPLLGKSSDELKRMAAGFAISEEHVRRATAADLAWKQVQQTVGVSVRDAANEMAPSIKELADSLGPLVRQATPLFKLAAGAEGDWLRTLGAAADRATRLADGFSRAKGAWDAMNAAAPSKGLADDVPLNPGLDAAQQALGAFVTKAEDVGPTLAIAGALARDTFAGMGNDVQAFVAKWLPFTDALAEVPIGDTGRTKRLVEALIPKPPEVQALEKTVGLTERLYDLIEKTAEAQKMADRFTSFFAGPQKQVELLDFLKAQSGFNFLKSLKGLGEDALDNIAGMNGPLGAWGKRTRYDGPLFTPAIKAGSREAYSIEIERQYGHIRYQGKEEEKAHTENGRTLKDISKKLDDLTGTIKGIGDRIEGF